MKGLRADGAGANGQVHLGLIEGPMIDPHCWSVLQTFHLIRDCGNRHHVDPTLVGLTLTSGVEDLPNNTTTHTLLVQLQMLGCWVPP